MKNTPDTDPSIIRPAATVILIREKAGKLQVYLMKRSSKSAFMAGKFVFPGGKLDSNDQLFHIFSNNCDLKRNEIGARFGPDLSDKQALAYCVATVRETLENIQNSLFQKAKQHLDESIVEAKDYDDFLKLIKERKLVKTQFCGDVDCEDEIKTETGGATTRCVPLDSQKPQGKCIHCDREAAVELYFSKNY